MARYNYSTMTPTGQILASAISKLINGKDDLARASSIINVLTAADAEKEVGIPQDQYNDLRNAISLLEQQLKATGVTQQLVMLDQG